MTLIQSFDGLCWGHSMMKFGWVSVKALIGLRNGFDWIFRLVLRMVEVGAESVYFCNAQV